MDKVINEIELTTEQIQQMIFEKETLMGEFETQERLCNERASAWNDSNRSASRKRYQLQRDIQNLKESKLWSHIMADTNLTNLLEHVKEIEKTRELAKTKILKRSDVNIFKELIKRTRSDCFYVMQRLDNTMSSSLAYDKNVSGK